MGVQITTIDARLQPYAAGDPVVARLRSVPGVGLVVALTFRAQIDEVRLFTSASQVSAALGLVPHEDSSAERRHRGHITKAGPPELRSLLVQAAWLVIGWLLLSFVFARAARRVVAHGG